MHGKVFIEVPSWLQNVNWRILFSVILFESQIGLKLHDKSIQKWVWWLKVFDGKKIVLNELKQRTEAMENRFYKLTKIIYNRKRQFGFWRRMDVYNDTLM